MQWILVVAALMPEGAKTMQWVLVMLWAILVPAVALAAPEAAAAQSWWQVLLIEVIKAALAIAVPVLSALVFVLLRRIELNVELAQLQTIASAAAGWAEQKAYKGIAQGKPMPSADKLAAAITYGAELARRYKLHQRAAERLEGLIEAKLGQQRLADRKLAA